MKNSNDKSTVRIVEAILFASPEPITPAKIARAAGVGVRRVRDAIFLLQEEYKTKDTALEVIEVGGKYAMRVKPEYHTYVERFRGLDMERGILRTLAVIAVKQPVKLSEVAKLRGNRCYEHVKKLEELGFIQVEKSGKTKIITTTKKFAEYFGLKAADPEYVKEFLLKASKRSGLEKYIREKT
jgi:segregation and condensation protein B